MATVRPLREVLSEMTDPVLVGEGVTSLKRSCSCCLHFIISSCEYESTQKSCFAAGWEHEVLQRSQRKARSTPTIFAVISILVAYFDFFSVAPNMSPGKSSG